MRTTLRPLLAVSGLCLPVLALFAPEAPRTVLAPAVVAVDDDEDEEHHDGDHHGEEEVLHEAMETLNDGLRELRRQLAEGDVDAMLPTLDEIQMAVVEGKGETPETVESVPEEQRGAFVRDFRSQQLLLLEKLCRLERLILEGDLEAANEHLAAEVMAMKRGSHSRFKQPGGWTPR
jgi:hypothetical protein